LTEGRTYRGHRIADGLREDHESIGADCAMDFGQSNRAAKQARETSEAETGVPIESHGAAERASRSKPIFV